MRFLRSFGLFVWLQEFPHIVFILLVVCRFGWQRGCSHGSSQDPATVHRPTTAENDRTTKHYIAAFNCELRSFRGRRVGGGGGSGGHAQEQQEPHT